MRGAVLAAGGALAYRAGSTVEPASRTTMAESPW
jgi:hypothetical protein